MLGRYLNLTNYTKKHESYLRKLLDDLNKNLRALKSLKQPKDSWNPLIIYLTCTKLNDVTKRKWEECNDKDSPSLKDFTIFLEKGCQLLEKLIQVKASNKRKLK